MNSNPGYHSIHSRSLFQVFKELNYVHPNKMSQLFLISPHLRSWFQPKIGLQMLYALKPLSCPQIPLLHVARSALANGPVLLFELDFILRSWAQQCAMSHLSCSERLINFVNRAWK